VEGDLAGVRRHQSTLGRLALLVVVGLLKKIGKPVFFALAPMIFMNGMTLWRWGC
jgi:hypothetical protein